MKENWTILNHLNLVVYVLLNNNECEMNQIHMPGKIKIPSICILNVFEELSDLGEKKKNKFRQYVCGKWFILYY